MILNRCTRAPTSVLGIFLDTETNGLNLRRHKVVEIALKIIDITTGEFKDSFESLVSTSPEEWNISDPESLRVNGFTWEEIVKGKPAQEVGQSIITCFAKNQIKRGEAVFICQNPSFDRAFFSQLVDPDMQEKFLWPYHWLDLASMFWVKAMESASQGKGHFPWKTGLSKDKIAQAYQLPSEASPHRAMNGVNHLILCYTAVVGFPSSNSYYSS